MSKGRSAPGDLEHVRRFVNTLAPVRDVDLLGDTSGMANWFVQEGLAPAGLRVTGADLARARALRDALRAMLAAHTDGTPATTGAGRVLDQTARRARLALRFADDGGASLVPEAGGVNGALGRLLTIVHDSIAQGTWARLKACRDPTCGWAFYDHTKNHSGAWCSMEGCGNRAKARAYRERHGAAAGS